MSLTPLSRYFGCRVSDAFAYQGQPCILMENDRLLVWILPGKGAEFFNITYKPLDISPLARHSFDLAPAPYPPTVASMDGSFMDYNFGGWQVMFPNAGGPATINGAYLGRHGEAAMLPWNWQIVGDNYDEVSLHLWVQLRRTPFRMDRTITLRINEARLVIDETITNTGGVAWPYLWGQHPAFGAPFLSSDCVLDVPARTVSGHEQPTGSPNRLPSRFGGEWPIVQDVHGRQLDLRQIPPPQTGSADMFYLTDLSAGWYALTNRALSAGFALAWDVEVFPVLWVWQEFTGTKASPWFSKAYTMGLEPCSGYSTDGSAGLNELIKSGEAPTLSSGEKRTTRYCAMLYHQPGIEGVSDITDQGKKILFHSGDEGQAGHTGVPYGL